jgi:hypothetical protein
MKCTPVKQDVQLSKLKFNSKLEFDNEKGDDRVLQLKIFELVMGKS